MHVLEESIQVNPKDYLIILILAAFIVVVGLISHWMELGDSVLSMSGVLFIGFIVLTILFHFHQNPRQYVVTLDDQTTVTENFHVIEERSDGTFLIQHVDDVNYLIH